MARGIVRTSAYLAPSPPLSCMSDDHTTSGIDRDLYGSLTTLSRAPLPPMALAVSLLQALAKGVVRARRNNQLLYRFTQRACYLCNTLNNYVGSATAGEETAAQVALEEFLQTLSQIEE